MAHLYRRPIGQATWLALCLAVAVSSTGCTAKLTRGEESYWGTLLHKGIVYDPIPFKSKPVSGTLSFIIPGLGHLYAGELALAWVYFLGNVLWPLSILWTVPGSIQATEVTNKRRTVEYYQIGAYRQAVQALRRTGKLPPGFRSYEEVQGWQLEK